VAIGDEYIQEAVVVEIQEAAPQPRNGIVDCQVGRIGDIREIEVAIIAVESLVVIGKRGDEKIEAAVAVVVSDGNPMDAWARPSLVSAKPER